MKKTWWLSFQDPQDTLKEECALKKECVKLQEELDRCTERVNSRTNTSETCAQELYDFVHCVDHCVSKLGTKKCASPSCVTARGVRGGGGGIPVLARAGTPYPQAGPVTGLGGTPPPEGT